MKDKTVCIQTHSLHIGFWQYITPFHFLFEYKRLNNSHEGQNGYSLLSPLSNKHIKSSIFQNEPCNSRLEEGSSLTDQNAKIATSPVCLMTQVFWKVFWQTENRAFGRFSQAEQLLRTKLSRVVGLGKLGKYVKNLTLSLKKLSKLL